MPKYWGKLSASGDSPNWVKSKRRRKRRGLNDGNNNGQLHIANVTSGGTRKPPGLIVNVSFEY